MYLNSCQKHLLEDSYSHDLGKYTTVEEMLEDKMPSRYECHAHGPVSVNVG